MQELSATWVPGTFDVVRLTVGTRRIEVTSTRLSRIFGVHALNDLYLKGRVTLTASQNQVAMLT